MDEAGEDPYVRVEAREVYANRWLTVERHVVVHPGGAPGEHVLIRGAAPSGVLVVDGEDAILVEQPRFAARRRVLEIVKGGREPGETPLAAARRELREELGYAAARWSALGEVRELPSLMEAPLALFAAEELRAGDACPEETETLRPVRMALAAAYRAALEGGIDDAATVAALLRYRDGRRPPA